MHLNKILPIFRVRPEFPVSGGGVSAHRGAESPTTLESPARKVGVSGLRSKTSDLTRIFIKTMCNYTR